MRALRGLFGARFLVKAKESAEVLRDEFREGAREAEDHPEPTLSIPHRERKPDEPDEPDR